MPLPSIVVLVLIAAVAPSPIVHAISAPSIASVVVVVVEVMSSRRPGVPSSIHGEVSRHAQMDSFVPVMISVKVPQHAGQVFTLLRSMIAFSLSFVVSVLVGVGFGVDSALVVSWSASNFSRAGTLPPIRRTCSGVVAHNAG
jgi:hypothetical protein